VAERRSNSRLTRVAVSQRFLPHYRVRFFDELYARLRKRGIDFRLFYSYEMGTLNSAPTWATRISGMRADMKLAELEESAIVAPMLAPHLAWYSPDVCIVEDLAGLPNSLVAASYCRIARKPYLIWGLGQVPQKKTSRLRRFLAPLIRYLYDGAFGFVCYSNHAASVYSRYRKPTFLAPNSTMAPPTQVWLQQVRESVAKRYPAKPCNVISIGALKQQKRYDVLLHGIARTQSVVLHLIGDGPELSALKDLAQSLGISERIIFHGAMYEPSEKQALVLAAHIGVIPGRGGLAIQELMSYGVPVISGVADGTERDLIVDGVTGYLIEDFPTPERVAATLERFMSLDANAQREMAVSALDVVSHRSNIAVMAAGFEQAIDEALAC
jgi:glycosyltransferase involved in cell wall biosynthesis